MKHKILLSLVAVLLSALSAQAYDFKSVDLYYNITSDSTVEVTYEYPFSSKNYSGLTSVTIPSSVTYNGTTYSVVSIGIWAFYSCTSLTTITIPNSIKEIGVDAFAGTLWFNNFPDGVVCINNILYKYKGIMPQNTSITIPQGIISINSNAFQDCTNLTSISIPNSVTSIGQDAFDGCSNLTSISFPNSLTNIGVDAFAGTPWFNNLPDGVVYINNILYKYKGIMPQNTSITIPQGIISINSNAFYNCSGLTSITIPNTVTNIGDLAFSRCSNLTSISIPNSVTTIGYCALAGCSSLASITIPNSVTKIGNQCFGGCSSLSSIIVDNGNPNYDSRNNCNAIIETASNSLISGCSSTVIPNTITSIEKTAFFGCANLTSITIPNNVTSIGSSAFQGCSGLTSITLPNSIMSIEDCTFWNCSSLVSITIPNTVTNIGEMAFENCSSLTSIIIPNGVMNIRSSTFRGCSSLTSIIIPNSVTKIGDGAFGNCSQLMDITCKSANPPICYYDNYFNRITSFENVPSNCIIKVPCHSLATYNKRAPWNQFQLKIIPPPSLQVQPSSESLGSTKIDQDVDCDSTAIVSATANYGYHFVQWSDSVTVNPRLIKLTIDTVLTAEFARNAYNITLTHDGEGTIESDTTALYQDTIALNAVANYGWQFSGWSDGVLDNPRSIVVTADCEYHAIFVRQQFSLTTIAENGVVDGVGTFAYEDTCQLTATPNTGYHFVQWNDGVTENPRLIVLTKDTNLTAEFAKNSYQITTSHTGNGMTMGDTTALYQDTITLSALADYGWEFGSWSDNNVGRMDNPRTIVVTADCEYYAIFVRQQFSLTAIAENGVVDGVGIFAYEDTCQLTATPNTGYHFVQWNDGVTENPRTIVLMQDTNLTAEFAKNAYNITLTQEGAGTIEGDTIALYQDSVTLAAIADYGWQFSSWSDGVLDNPRSIVVTADCEYHAIFVRQQFSLTAIAENGVVDGVGTFAYEDTCQLTATPNTGYHFAQWSDGVTENPRSIVLTQDTNLTAEFAKNSYQITTSHTGNGMTMGDTTALYQDSITLSALADYGWEFSSWEDGNTENPRVVVATEDKDYKAIFVKRIFTIILTGENGTFEGAGSFAYGDTCQLTATPNIGYHFVQWNDSITDNPRSIVLTQDTTLTAVFAQSFAGQCGDSLYWNYGDNELNITGTGAMYDYTQTTMPWMLFRDSIYMIRIGDSATYIGEYAFAGCRNIGTLFVGESVDTIAENTLANCRNLHVVYCYPTIPPYAENNSFMNYNGYLYVPCDSKHNYSLDYVWGNFKYIVCLGTEDVTVTNDSVIVEADNTTATFTWPSSDDAETYSIVITKDGEVFCTLIFNTQGQLMTIAFAPSKDGSHHAPAAQLTANGYQFTVRGLESETHYAFTLDAKDEERNVVAHYAGTFDTYNETAVENVPTESNVRKIYRDGNVYIIRDGEEYSILGQKL